MGNMLILHQFALIKLVSTKLCFIYKIENFNLYK